MSFALNKVWDQMKGGVRMANRSDILESRSLDKQLPSIVINGLNSTTEYGV